VKRYKRHKKDGKIKDAETVIREQKHFFNKVITYPLQEIYLFFCFAIDKKCLVKYLLNASPI